MVARSAWTRQWSYYHRFDYNLYTSEAVIDELESGSFPDKTDALSLIEQVLLLDVLDSVADAAEAYIAHHVMPNDPVGDALYLAVASVHKCDFLVTWNCRHLANANKFGHIRRVNTLLGLFVPNLVTPLELLGDKAE